MHAETAPPAPYIWICSSFISISIKVGPGPTLTWSTITGVAIDAVYTGAPIVAGDRATLVDVGRAILVGEAWVTVTDVVPLDIGTVVGVVGVTRGRTAGTLIYILWTVFTLPFYKGMNIGWSAFKNNEFLISRNSKVVSSKCAFKIVSKHRKKIHFYIINDDNVISSTAPLNLIA